MIHPLEKKYGLSASELLDAINRRFRAKVTLEGAVAEVHLGKHIMALHQTGIISQYEEHDLDAYPDYTIWLPSDSHRPYRVECKNVRDATEAYRVKGHIVAYKVETQKTRASKNDPKSRFYKNNQFEILAVCLGKKTQNWTEFMYIETKHLAKHSHYRDRLNVMHRVPLQSVAINPPWYNSLEDLIKGILHG